MCRVTDTAHFLEILGSSKDMTIPQDTFFFSLFPLPSHVTQHYKTSYKNPVRAAVQ